jgi:O-antigen ligase
MIVLLLILIFSLLLKVYPLKKNWFYQFFLPIVLIFLPIVFVAVIEDIIEYLLSLNNEFISEYFFRGFTSVEKILDDIARTNIWTEHIRLFKEHPWGLSTSEIDLYSIIYLSDGGSESFLTRILVRFGFSAFFFYLFIFSLLKRALDDRDNYLYIFTYIFIFIGVNYGSFFAAYNMLFLILMSSINNKYAIEKE